jgi:putative FmdB family regulatory protein
MPIYEYAAKSKGCPYCEGHFELLEKLSAEPLAVCPKCAAEITRVITAPSVAVGNSHLLKESHAAKHGFTQYRRAGDGVYEKTAGKGPKYISGD